MYLCGMQQKIGTKKEYVKSALLPGGAVSTKNDKEGH